MGSAIYVRLLTVLLIRAAECRKVLHRALVAPRKLDTLDVSGRVDIILSCWDRRGRFDLLVMVCKAEADEEEAIVVQPGPGDAHSLILRAGPVAETMQAWKATLFGVGALGGYTATLLAESGLGQLNLVDPHVPLPGNVVRHVGGHGHACAAKVKTVRDMIADHAPWSNETGFLEKAGMPSAFR